MAGPIAMIVVSASGVFCRQIRHLKLAGTFIIRFIEQTINELPVESPLVAISRHRPQRASFANLKRNTPIMAKAFIFALLISFSLSRAAYAEAGPDAILQSCDKRAVDAVGVYLGIKDFSFFNGNEGVIVSGACKTWPANRAVTIAAFAYDAGTENEKKLIIAMIDQAKGKVISSHAEEIVEDSAMRVESDSLRLDTARYDLTEGTRAFGLDLTSGYIPNCGDGGWGAIRTLYVQQGTKIRPVLGGLIMSRWQFVQGGNPRCMSPEYAAKAPPTVTETTELAIAISKHKTNGYADLLITSTSSWDNGDKSKKGVSHVTLRYDGRQYPNNASAF